MPDRRVKQDRYMKDTFLIEFTDALESVVLGMKDFFPKEIGRRTFFRLMDRDLMQSLRGVAQFPCVCREGNGWRDVTCSYSENNGTVSKQRQTSFIVCDSYENRDDVWDIDEAVARCEMWGAEIVKGLIECVSPAVEAVQWNGMRTSTEVIREERIVMVQYAFVVESVVDLCRDVNLLNVER